MTYAQYLQTPHWRKVRRVVVRDRRVCEHCHNSKRLEVHHRTYRNIGRENLSELNLLCRKCHSRVTEGTLLVPPYRRITIWTVIFGILGGIKKLYNFAMRNRQVLLDDHDMKRLITATNYFLKHLPPQFQYEQAAFVQAMRRAQVLQDNMRLAKKNEVIEIKMERTQ